MASGPWQTWWRRWDCRLARRAARWARRLGAPKRRVCAITEGSGDSSGGVLALTAILHEQGIPVVWAYRDDPAMVPTWATGVRAGTARHRWLAARSRWWLTDGLPMKVSGPDTVGRPLERGRDTVVVAVVDPSIDKVGSDIVDWPLLTPRQQRVLTLRGETDIDLVAVPSPVTGLRQARALGFTAEAVVASPLAERVPTRQAARVRLGLGDAQAVVGVLLARAAPSWGEGELQGWDDVCVVFGGAEAPEADVIGACDVLVTDTCGWASVAARCDRPVIVMADDLRDLLSRGPGLYLPWHRELPGPFVSSASELREVISVLRASGWGVPPEYEIGHAALAALAGAEAAGGGTTLAQAMGVVP